MTPTGKRARVTSRTRVTVVLGSPTEDRLVSPERSCSDAVVSVPTIAGLHSVIACLEELILWPVLRHKEFVALRMRPPTGVLLHGPPGVGKTAVTRALVARASALTQCKLVSIDASEVSRPALLTLPNRCCMMYHALRRYLLLRLVRVNHGCALLSLMRHPSRH